MLTTKEISAGLPKLTLEELFDLNKLIVQTINFKQQLQNAQLSMKFSVGDKVTWKSRKFHGLPDMIGVITKCNSSTASVDCNFNGEIQKWKVAWALLKKVQ